MKPKQPNIVEALGTILKFLEKIPGKTRNSWKNGLDSWDRREYIEEP